MNLKYYFYLEKYTAIDNLYLTIAVLKSLKIPLKYTLFWIDF